MAHTPNNKVAAGLFALLLGSLGIHKFILGYTTEGIIMLLMTIVVIPLISLVTCGIGVCLYSIPATISFIEGIIYLSKSDEDFVATYVDNKRPWF